MAAASVTLFHGRVRKGWCSTCFGHEAPAPCHVHPGHFAGQSSYARQESKHVTSYPWAELPILTLRLSTTAKCHWPCQERNDEELSQFLKVSLYFQICRQQGAFGVGSRFLSLSSASSPRKRHIHHMRLFFQAYGYNGYTSMVAWSNLFLMGSGQANSKYLKTWTNSKYLNIMQAAALS